MTKEIIIGEFVLHWHGWRGWLNRHRWGIVKWRYFSEASWRHGTAYLGPFKVMW